MMKPTDFLIEKLNELFKSHSYLEIQYEFRDIMNLHIIEIKPSHCYESDRPYILKKIEIENEFESLFPNHEIMFMTENELFKIENPILSLGVSQISFIGQNFDCVKSYSSLTEINTHHIDYVYETINKYFSVNEFDKLGNYEFLWRSKHEDLQSNFFNKLLAKTKLITKKQGSVKSEPFLI